MTLPELLVLWKAEDALLARQIMIDHGGFDRVSERTHIEQLRLLRERTTALETALATVSPCALAKRWRDFAEELSKCDPPSFLAQRQVACLHQCADELESLALPPAPPQEQELHQSFERWMRVSNPDMHLARADADQPYDYANAFTQAIWEGWHGAKLAASPPVQEQELSDKQKMFVLLAEIRTCINDDNLMAAQRKVMAIEEILKSAALPPAHGWQPQEQDKETKKI